MRHADQEIGPWAKPAGLTLLESHQAPKDHYIWVNLAKILGRITRLTESFLCMHGDGTRLGEPLENPDIAFDGGCFRSVWFSSKS